MYHCDLDEYELSSGHSAPTSPDPYSEKIFDLPEVEVDEVNASEKKEPGILDIIGAVFCPNKFTRNTIPTASKLHLFVEDAEYKTLVAKFKTSFRKAEAGTGNTLLVACSPASLKKACLIGCLREAPGALDQKKREWKMFQTLIRASIKRQSDTNIHSCF